MADIFISYARENSDFVRALHAELQAAGRNAWVDWEGIPPVDKWLQKIHAAIDEADVFLFVISPASVQSEVCGVELDYAVKQHKRLIPLLHADAEGVPSELAELNWIFARDSDQLAEAVDTIETAVDTDLDWLRQHSRLLVRAGEWERSYGELLRGRELDDYEAWLEKAADKKPGPTELQTRYLLESRRAVSRRKSRLWTSLLVGLSLILLLGVYGWFQNRESLRQEVIAESRSLMNRAESQLDVSADDEQAHGSLLRGAASAVSALAAQQRIGVPVVEADRLVRKSYRLMPKFREISLDHARVDAAAFSRDGSRLVLLLGGKRLSIRDTADGSETASCSLPLTAMQQPLALEMNLDGSLVAVALYTASKAVDATGITLLALPGCEQRFETSLPGRIGLLSISRTGEILAAGRSGLLQLWNTQEQREITPDLPEPILNHALSPDGSHLAIYSVEREARKRMIRIHAVATGETLVEWEQQQSIASIRWLDDQRLLVIGRESSMLYHRNQFQAEPVGEGYSQLLDVRPDKALFAEANGRRLVIRRMPGGSEFARTTVDNEPVGMAIGRDGRSVFMVDAVDRLLRLWLYDASSAFAQESLPLTAKAIDFGSDGLLYVLHDDGRQTTFRIAAGESALQASVDGDDSRSPFPGQKLRLKHRVLSDPQGVTLLDTVTGKPSIEFQAEYPIKAADLSVGETRVALLLNTGSSRGGYKRRVEVRDAQSGEVLVSRDWPPVSDGHFPLLRFIGRDSARLALDTNDGVDLLDAKTLEPVFTAYHKGASTVYLNGNASLLATFGRSGLLRIWDTGSGAEIRRLEYGKSLQSLAIDNAGRWLAELDEEGELQLHLLKTDELIRQVCNWLPDPCPNLGGLDFP